MTHRALLSAVAERLAAAATDAPRRTAEWIVEEATGATRADLYARPDAGATDAEVRRALALADRRAAGEPVQYVVGHADFYGLRLAVTPDVLIPRPETEEVVEAALARIAHVAQPWVLDVGTGSGAVALAVKHARPDAEVLAVDLSRAALAVARGNAERLGLEVAFVEANAFRPAFADAVPAVFALLVSNPPYVPASERDGLQREVRDHEPPLALFVPDEDPLAPYRALAGHASRLLADGGWLVAETHADHGAAVARVFADTGLAGAACLPDLAGRDRIAVAQRAA